MDINGDQHMDWSEFMQYIIDAVMENSIGGNQNQSVKEIIKAVKLNKFKRFNLSYNI